MQAKLKYTISDKNYKVLLYFAARHGMPYWPCEKKLSVQQHVSITVYTAALCLARSSVMLHIRICVVYCISVVNTKHF